MAMPCSRPCTMRWKSCAVRRVVRFSRRSFPLKPGEEKYSAAGTGGAGAGPLLSGSAGYRVEGYQAMLGVPVPDATQWDQIEQVGDCGYVVFAHLEHLAAQGELIYQDDTRCGFCR